MFKIVYGIDKEQAIKEFIIGQTSNCLKNKLQTISWETLLRNKINITLFVEGDEERLVINVYLKGELKNKKETG